MKRGQVVACESEVAQLCLTLRDPTDCSLPGSSAHGIFQARVLEWVAISSSVVSNSATPWTVAHQAPLSMGFSRQEYWSGVPSSSLVLCSLQVLLSLDPASPVEAYSRALGEAYRVCPLVRGQLSIPLIQNHLAIEG